MFKFKLFSALFLIGITFLLFSCSDKTPTQSEETAQLSGYVFQEVNGFFYYIPNAEISIGSYNTTSDSIGRYSIEIPLGEYLVIAAHEQFDSSITDTIRIRGDRSYFIRLLNGPTYSVFGVVTDTLGAVVEGAIVELEHLRDTTDINGEYSFQDILSGQRSISCDYADYFIFTDSFEITNADITKNINLIRQGYNILGIVSHPVDGLLKGIEVILDDSLYDTTDINGEYLFENIYIGEHQLQVKSSTYNYDIFQFSLGKSDLYKELVIGKSTIQKIFIEKDAEVAYRTSTSSPENLYANSNYGNNSKFSVLLDFWYITSHIDPPYYHDEIRRFFIEAPEVNLSNVDSALLVLSLIDNFLLEDVVISKLSDPWDEMTITWDNQPEIVTDSIILTPEIIDSAWTLNIIGINNILTNTYGFKITFQVEGCGLSQCSNFLSFHSSESVELEKRPYVLIYRTE